MTEGEFKQMQKVFEEIDRLKAYFSVENKESWFTNDPDLVSSMI